MSDYHAVLGLGMVIGATLMAALLISLWLLTPHDEDAYKEQSVEVDDDDETDEWDAECEGDWRDSPEDQEALLRWGGA